MRKMNEQNTLTKQQNLFSTESIFENTDYNLKNDVKIGMELPNNGTQVLINHIESMLNELKTQQKQSVQDIKEVCKNVKRLKNKFFKFAIRYIRNRMENTTEILIKKQLANEKLFVKLSNDLQLVIAKINSTSEKQQDLFSTESIFENTNYNLKNDANISNQLPNNDIQILFNNIESTLRKLKTEQMQNNLSIINECIKKLKNNTSKNTIRHILNRMAKTTHTLKTKLSENEESFQELSVDWKKIKLKIAHRKLTKKDLLQQIIDSNNALNEKLDTLNSNAVEIRCILTNEFKAKQNDTTKIKQLERELDAFKQLVTIMRGCADDKERNDRLLNEVRQWKVSLDSLCNVYKICKEMETLGNLNPQIEFSIFKLNKVLDEYEKVTGDKLEWRL